jgi:hypothetical protein
VIETSFIGWAELSRLLPENGNKMQSPKRFVYRNSAKDCVQEANNWIKLLTYVNFSSSLWKCKLLFFCRVGVPPPRLKTETDPVSETLCFLFVEIRTMDKVRKLNSNEF